MGRKALGRAACTGHHRHHRHHHHPEARLPGAAPTQGRSLIYRFAA
ncbi:hypothetical protein B7755_012215 [Streptomyces sp. NBS 14/10]|nr:hypothetical protein [Streptomyces sp. NBS 14/10]KAK1178837.1 hypothetical protein B7755_012215 [Streptomyces sp. NBS 14/10]